MKKASANDPGDAASDKQIKMLAAKLGECFEEDRDANRHIVLSYLFDAKSSKDLTKRQASTAISWLVGGEAKDAQQAQHAQAEANAIALHASSTDMLDEAA